MQPTAALYLSLVSVVIISTSPQSLAAGDPQQKNFSSLSHPSWSLGLQVYRTLRSEGAHINTLISPVLLANSLSALSHTAKGATARQLQELIKADKDEKSSSSPLKSMRKANGTSYILHSSSAIFSKQVPTLESGLLDKLRAQFELDFVDLGPGDKQGDMEKLSSWANSAMGGVKEMQLNEGPDVKKGALILASALHFKGLWDHGFVTEDEDLRSFLGTKYTKVHMMHTAGEFHHYEDIENMVQVLEMGLCGGKASMVLLLPFHVENLARLERMLTLEQLEKWLGKLSSMSMALSLPRVNVSSTLSLQKQLAALGVVNAWDQKVADFSGLGKVKLHLGEVLHWASLELACDSGDKDGVAEDQHVEKPKPFYADHSFIILVKDNVTGALLMLGALDLAEGVALHDEL